MSDEDVETFTMSLAGRDVVFRKPHLGQLIMLRKIANRSLRQAESAEAQDAKAMAMDSMLVRAFDFIETLIISDEDKAFVEEAALDGKISYSQLMRALSGGKGGDEIEDDATPTPKKPVRRSPKAAKPTAKPVASRGRAKR